jgi:hypothetical protein
MMNIVDWIAALGCLLAVKGLLQESNSSKRWMWYSFYVGMAVSIFWTYYLLKYVILQTTPLSLSCQNVAYLASATLAVTDTDQQHVGLIIQLLRLLFLVRCRLPRIRWDVVWLPLGPLMYDYFLFL